MGKRKCIDKGDGSAQYNYEFCFTINGDDWLTVLFEDLDDARDYAYKVLGENEDNARLRYFARRVVLVDTCDFFDRDIPAVCMRVIDRHSEGRR